MTEDDDDVWPENDPVRHVDLDLGLGYELTWFGWHPDRELNPQHAGHPDIERAGAMIRHRTPLGRWCSHGVTFELPETEVLGVRNRWRVVSWEPLMLEPSLLCRVCGDHGFVKNGKWVPA